MIAPSSSDSEQNSKIVIHDRGKEISSWQNNGMKKAAWCFLLVVCIRAITNNFPCQCYEYDYEYSYVLVIQHFSVRSYQNSGHSYIKFVLASLTCCHYKA